MSEERDALAHLLDVIRCSNVEALYSEVLRLRQVERAAILVRDTSGDSTFSAGWAVVEVRSLDLLTRAIAHEAIEEEEWPR